MGSNLIVLCGLLLAVGLVVGHRHHHRHNHGGRHCGGWGCHHHGHHGRHHWRPQVPLVNFEVHQPKGLEVSMVQRTPNVTFFGMEIYVNKDPNSTIASCDVCHNTTTVSYGKFIITDEDAIIKRGDILFFYVLTGDSKNVTKHFMQKLWVTDSIISKCNCQPEAAVPDIDMRFNTQTQAPVVPAPLPGTQTDTFDFDEIGRAHQNNDLFSEERTALECDRDPVTNLCRFAKEYESRTENMMEPGDPQRELEVYEGIINQMAISCPSRNTSKLLMLKNVPTSAAGDLMGFVKSWLSSSLELQELGGLIRSVYPVGRTVERGVIIQMPSYIEKQKLLYYAKQSRLNDVVDYDLAGTWN